MPKVRDFPPRISLLNENLEAYQWRRMMNTILLIISHGYRTEDKEDPLFRMTADTISMASKVITPNTYLVDSLPAREYYFGSDLL